MKRWSFLASATAVIALLAGGCSTLDERQREWIFQPSDRSWGNTADQTAGMEQVWIDFQSSLTGEPARLHGLWLGGKPESADTPVLLYLHGARYNVDGSAPRIRRMHELGFSVLAIDYRGFGKSTKGLPSEETAREDARAAWTRLAARHPAAAPLHLRTFAGRCDRHRTGGQREGRKRAGSSSKCTFTSISGTWL